MIDVGRDVVSSGFKGLGLVFNTRCRWLGLATGLVYAAIYLIVSRSAFITDVDQSRFAAIPSIRFADSLSLSSLFDRFENVVIVYLHENLVVVLSIPVIVFTLLLSTLVGVNLAAAAYSMTNQRRLSCSRMGPTFGMFSALPSFLASFSCCAPTLLLIVGANFATAVVAMLAFATPVSVLLLAGLLLWNGNRALSSAMAVETDSRHVPGPDAALPLPLSQS